jgi:peptide chain release factor 3
MYVREFPVHKACWVKPDDAKKFKEFKRIKQSF